MARALTTLLVLLALLPPLIGCGGSRQPITYQRVNRALYDAKLDGHRGQVILVDVWALWCAPCLERFPRIVALQNQHRKNGLIVMTLNLDGADSRDSVLTFLRQKRAQMEHMQSAIEGRDAAAEEFDLPPGIPYYRLYDRSGELRFEFAVANQDERFESPDNLEKRVAELLAESP